MTNTTEPSPYTAEEARQQFLRKLRSIVDYWERESRAVGSRAKMEGMAFSILTLFDGEHVGFPAVTLLVRPHPDDAEYHKSRGERWYPEGLPLNADCHLHEVWVQKPS